jgi:hypothetical protein
VHRAISSVVGGVCAAAFFLPSAVASGSGAYLPDTSVAPQVQSDLTRSREGLKAFLFATTDLDWREQIANASNSTPHLKAAVSVEHGKKIAIFVLAGNPKLDQQGRANVRVSFVVTNPKGVKDSTPADMECIVGAIEPGSEGNLRNCAADLTFVGDPGDPSGLWNVEATITDVNGSTRLLLRTRFQLE